MLKWFQWRVMAVTDWCMETEVSEDALAEL